MYSTGQNLCSPSDPPCHPSFKTTDLFKPILWLAAQMLAENDELRHENVANATDNIRGERKTSAADSRHRGLRCSVRLDRARRLLEGVEQNEDS